MIIDKEKIDPFNEEDWDEKDLLFVKYGYKFNDHLRTIDVSQNIRYNKIDVECSEEDSENIIGYKVWKIINEKLNRDIRSDSDSYRFYKNLYGKIGSVKTGIFSFSLNKLLFTGSKRTYFLNPFKEYTIIINKNNLNVTVVSEYKWFKKTRYKLYNDGVISLKFRYSDAKLALIRLNNVYNEYINECKDKISIHRSLCRARKNYKLNLIQ